MSDTVSSLLREIEDIGVDPLRGGYTRPGWSRADLELREWFTARAHDRGLDVEADQNGVLWAWDAPGGDRSGAVVTGSHLDSVPGGGAFDGPLGVASALIAHDLVASRQLSDRRPLAIAVFPEEEGSRFGLACLGSQLMTGDVAPAKALALKDDAGNTFADACRQLNLNPDHLGADREALRQIDTFVELHVEQGRGLIDLERPVAVASSILGHGRWRITVTGEGNHAGATLMADRRDPVVAAARTVVAIQSLARGTPRARATVGRLTPSPGGTNVIASRVDVWVDVRHPDDKVVHQLVERIRLAAQACAVEEGCAAVLTEESYSPTVDFDAVLRDDLAEVLGGVPVIGTGAGHDAGVLKQHVRTAMLFVRNPTGVSHSPEEHVEESDAEVGASALAACLAHLLVR
jgi:N-carbamoyl-L-amino-acid hydrolase